MTAIDRIRSNGLELELAPRRMSGPLVGGWQPRQVVAAALQAPAFVLLAVLVVPSVATVWFALRAKLLVVVCCAAVVCVAWTVRRLPRVDWRPGPAELSLWGVWLAGVVCTAVVQAARHRWVAAGGWAAVALTGAVLLAHWIWLYRNNSRTRTLLAGACGLWLAGALALAVGVATRHDWRPVGDGVAVVGWAAAVVPGVALMVRGTPPGSGGDRARAVVVGWAWLATVVGVAVVVVMRADRLALIGWATAMVPGVLFLAQWITLGRNGIRSNVIVRWAWSAVVVGVAILVVARDGWRAVGDGMAVAGWVIAAAPGMVICVWGEAFVPERFRARVVVTGWVWGAIGVGVAVVVGVRSPVWAVVGLGGVVVLGVVALGRWWRVRGESAGPYAGQLLPGAVGVAAVVGVCCCIAGREAYLMTVVWVVLTIGLLGLTVGLAWVLRRGWWPWWPLIVPFGVSAFVGGLAWRLIFEPVVDPVTSVRWQAFFYAVMLGAAFLWSWFGAMFVLLRAAISSIEADPVRSANLDALHGWDKWRRLIAMLNPVLVIVGLVVTVAAARVFDIILVGVPGPQQYTLDSVTLHWWHLPADTAADRAGQAVFSLPFAVLLGLLAWWLQTGTRRHHTRWPAPAPRAIPVHLRTPITWRAGWLFLRIGVVSLATLGPLIVLIVMSWQGFDGPALVGADAVWRDSELWRALRNTALVAVVATLLTVTAALPPAYYAADLVSAPARDGRAWIENLWVWRTLVEGTRLGRSQSARKTVGLAQDWRARVGHLVVVFLVVLAVLPAQVYIGPIRSYITDHDLAGTSMPLILMHAAIGLPIAILILRGALLAPPESPPSDTRREPASAVYVMRGVARTAGPAVGAVAVLQLVQVWNDFFIGLQVRGADASPWSLLLWSEARHFHESAAHLAAGALLSAVPPVLVLLATWRRFLIPGLTGGVLR